MPWTNPRTWTPGEIVTATMLNQQLRDNLNATDHYAIISDAIINVTNSASETSVFSFTIPANTLAGRSWIETAIIGALKYDSASDRTFTARYYFGPPGGAAGITYSRTFTATNDRSSANKALVFRFSHSIANTAPFVVGEFLYTSPRFNDVRESRLEYGDFSVNTGVDNELKVTIQWSGADTGVLFSFRGGRTVVMAV